MSQLILWNQALEGVGASAPPEREAERREWLREALRAHTRIARHPGNHRYVWELHRAALLPDARDKACSYPKRLAAPCGAA